MVLHLQSFLGAFRFLGKATSHHTWTALLLTAAVFGPGARPLHAEPITLQGGGVLLSVQSQTLQIFLGVSASSGEPFRFSIIFDPNATDLFPDNPAGAFYDFGRAQYSLTFGSNTVAVDLRTFGRLGNLSSGLADTFLFEGSTDDGHFGVQLFSFDPSGSWLSSDAWPADVAATLNAAPGPIVFDIVDSFTENQDSIAMGFAQGFTQGDTPAPVPEPGTFVLIGSGLAMGLRRWHTRRHQRTDHDSARG